LNNYWFNGVVANNHISRYLLVQLSSYCLTVPIVITALL